jgi:hypothetical protein
MMFLRISHKCGADWGIWGWGGVAHLLDSKKTTGFPQYSPIFSIPHYLAFTIPCGDANQDSIFFSNSSYSSSYPTLYQKYFIKEIQTKMGYSIQYPNLGGSPSKNYSFLKCLL